MTDRVIAMNDRGEVTVLSWSWPDGGANLDAVEAELGPSMRRYVELLVVNEVLLHGPNRAVIADELGYHELAAMLRAGEVPHP